MPRAKIRGRYGARLEVSVDRSDVTITSTSTKWGVRSDTYDRRQVRALARWILEHT
jgi:hypothetical protein